MKTVLAIASLPIALGLGASLTGCPQTPAVPTSSSTGGAEDPPPIADAWMSKCGACHDRPQPKLRSRAYVTDALSRHRRRVSLSEDEWAAMIDFMSK